MNYSKPADELRTSELFSAQSVAIGNAGQAEKRKGSTPYINTALNSGATITGCGKQRFSASSKRVFAFAGDKFFEDVSGTWTDRTGGLTITAGNMWSLANASGTLIGHNGVSGDSLVKWTAAGGNLAAWSVSSRFTWAQHVVWYDRRAWAFNLSSGTDRGWYSDSGDFETFAASSFFQFGEDVTGAERFATDKLAVHTEQSIFLLVPTGNADTPYAKFNVTQDSSKPDEGLIGGTVSGRSIVNLPDGTQIFVRREGIFQFDGSSVVKKISKKLDGSRYWADIQKDELSNSFAVHYADKEQVWFFLPHGTGQTNLNHCMVYDYGLSGVVGEHVWYGPFTGNTRACGAIIDDLPTLGGYDGKLYSHDTGNADNDGADDNAIDGWFETASAAPTNGADDVTWQKARHFYEVTGDHDAEITQQSPGIDATIETLEMGGSYDAIGVDFGIGVSAIAGDNIVEFEDTDISGIDPFTKLRYRNGNANEPFSIRRAILYAQGNFRRFKMKD